MRTCICFMAASMGCSCRYDFKAFFWKCCSSICPHVFRVTKDLSMRLHSTDVNQANGKSLRDDLQEALESTNVAADEAHSLEKQ
jgi:hypothetical protein